ncbi:MAG TPA: hypothetical protein VH518_20210 [Tepidisphaeraceae bacterium]
MHWIDWILVLAPLLLVLGMAVYTHRYVKSVADFLSAGRCAGRYLLANARGESDAGLSNTMSKFEQIMVSGFVLSFWGQIQTPVLLLVAISGFIVYRFRETRALTLGQFLEVRYSRRFRLFMGGLAFFSGILNYGVFPAISARFFIYFLDLPLTLHLGPVSISTFALIMFLYLTCTLFMVLVGGQVTAMVTDCIEGIFSHLIYIVVVVAVLLTVHWSQIVQVMESAPAGKSQINPFDAGGVEDFNFWFVMMYLAIQVYQRMALQNKQGFNSAARTPHESRMGDVLGNWRGYARNVMLLVLAICALTYMKHPDFAREAAPINNAINSIPADRDDGYMRKQMTVPIALRYLLPVGMKGLFCSMMVMGLLAGDSGHMHSWGSIFVQDVLLPLRRKPMSPRQHIWALRAAVTFVAAFAFAFSLLYPQQQYIALWWALTGGIFIGGAGVAIIGGLYWKKGTAAAAWAGAITGSCLSLLGILLTNKAAWGWFVANAGPSLASIGISTPAKFWFNGQQTQFFSACVAVCVYVIVSLLSGKHEFNLDRMLHRGVYAVEAKPDKPVTRRGGIKHWLANSVLRFDENFTFWDKVVSAGIFWWSIALAAVMVTITIWNLGFERWPVAWWAKYWLIVAIVLPFLIALATLVWFGIGGIIDIRDFFRALATMKRDFKDDGTVSSAAEGGRGLVPVPVKADSAAEPVAK